MKLKETSGLFHFSYWADDTENQDGAVTELEGCAMPAELKGCALLSIHQEFFFHFPQQNKLIKASKK